MTYVSEVVMRGFPPRDFLGFACGSDGRIFLAHPDWLGSRVAGRSFVSQCLRAAGGAASARGLTAGLIPSPPDAPRFRRPARVLAVPRRAPVDQPRWSIARWTPVNP